jgi:hypothetical protein
VSEFVVASSLWLEIGAERRLYNSQVRTLPKDVKQKRQGYMPRIIKIASVLIICSVLALLIQNFIRWRHESAANHAIDSMRQKNHWSTNQISN